MENRQAAFEKTDQTIFWRQKKFWHLRINKQNAQNTGNWYQSALLPRQTNSNGSLLLYSAFWVLWCQVVLVVSGEASSDYFLCFYTPCSDRAVNLCQSPLAHIFSTSFSVVQSFSVVFCFTRCRCNLLFSYLLIFHNPFLFTSIGRDSSFCHCSSSHPVEDRRQSQEASPQTSDEQRWEPGRTHTGSLCGAIRLAIPAAAATSRTRCPFDKSSQFYVDIQLESQPLFLTGPSFLLNRYWHSSSYQKGSVNNFVGIFHL